MSKNNNWKNILQILIDNKLNFKDTLVEEELRVRTQFFFVFIIFFLVSAVMSVVNVITNYRLLMWMTVAFSAVNLINVIFMLISPITEKIARVSSPFELVILFSSFLVSGVPQGFAATWIALLPACCFLLYRLKHGLLISGVQFFILVFFLWTPFGNSFLSYTYTSSFRLRFPLLYFAAFLLGAFFEYMRYVTQKELVSSKSKYENLSSHDVLTGLYNRMGFYEVIDKANRDGLTKNGSAFVLMDVDNFKKINDAFGHNFGDIVLKKTTALVKDTVGDKGCVCRWGGDEIAVYIYSRNDAEPLCNEILTGMRSLDFIYAGNAVKSTLSIGAARVCTTDGYKIEALINAADAAMYEAKVGGRNRLVLADYTGV